MIEVTHDFVPKIKKFRFYSRAYKILSTFGMVRNKLKYLIILFILPLIISDISNML